MLLRLASRLAPPALSALAAALVSSPSAVDLAVPRGAGMSVKKAAAAPESAPVVATLVDTHGDARVPLRDAGPSADRFAALLADRVTGEQRELDPRLLALLRAVAKEHAEAGPPRVELVSGYRSPKRNEMMRKKGHHVASHSQHSLGHAVDFSVVPAGEEKGVDPRALEREIRALGWQGGVGVYTQAGDWFVHCDVGKTRHWDG